MDIEVLKKEINEYFEYIKTIYINEFSKYMTEDTKKNIQSLTDIFEFQEELSFKVTNDKKIIFHLDLKSFIEENGLRDEKNLIDISEKGKEYVNYLIQNENTIYQIIKNKILKEIIHYFCKCGKDVVSLGTADMITEYLGQKYKLPYEQFISSKEKEAAIYIKEIVGEKLLFASIINHQEQLIEDSYNLYVENNDLENYHDFKFGINRIYDNYAKKIGKVYFTDSLYDYENLDYGISSRSKQVREEKKNLSMMQLKRLSSLKSSLLDIDNHQFLFTSSERMMIKNSRIETDKIIEAIMIDGRDHVLDHIGDYYNRLLKIEENSLAFAQKLWASTLTTTSDYELGKDFNFLITNSLTDEIIEATYITSNHLKKIKTSRNDYGFIIEPVEAGLVYASSKNFLYRNYGSDKQYKPTCNTIYANDIPLEIDNQEVSKLITPDMIEKDNLREKMIHNKVLLDQKHIRKIGIYCFSDEMEDSPSYNKALLISEEYELPLVRISPRNYFNGVEERIKIDDVKMVVSEDMKPISFSDRVKALKDKFLYEDSESTNELEKAI